MSENNNSGSVHEHLELMIYGYNGALGIGKDAIRLLNNPDYISIRVNPELLSIAIVPCERHDPLSYEVPPRLLTDRKCTFRIYSLEFKNWIRSVIGIDDSKTYTVAGKYSARSNLVYFPIGQGQVRELYEKHDKDSGRMSS